MKTQIAVIMAILAGAGTVNVAANAATVTPPPAIAKAMASTHRQYCLVQVRTGIQWPWPLVIYYHRTCAPTKADLHIYEQARFPFVKAVRDHFHAPVWSIRQAVNFCAKREGMIGWNIGKNTTAGQISSIRNRCFSPKK